MRFKLTPLNSLLGATVLFAALSAVGLVRPNASDDNAETDRCLVEEIGLHPDNATAHYFRALLHMKMGNQAVAKAELESAKSLDPSAAFAGGAEVLKMVERDIASPPKTSAASAAHAFPVAAGALAILAGVAAAAVFWRRRRRLARAAQAN